MLIMDLQPPDALHTRNTLQQNHSVSGKTSVNASFEASSLSALELDPDSGGSYLQGSGTWKGWTR